jgi:serine/threonine protein phosphatase PrpC
MLDEVHPTVFSVTLHADDVLLFLSDGITDAFGSSSDLLDYLKKKAPLNPQAIADDVLSSALRRTNGVAEDDMTALAVRLFSATPIPNV